MKIADTSFKFSPKMAIKKEKKITTHFFKNVEKFNFWLTWTYPRFLQKHCDITGQLTQKVLAVKQQKIPQKLVREIRALCLLAFLKITHTFTHTIKNSANRHCHNEQFQKKELGKFNFCEITENGVHPSGHRA